MSFITIIFVVALLNLTIGYALGLAWLRVTATHKTPAESTAYEIVPDSNRNTAESSCHAPKSFDQEIPTALQTLGDEQHPQPLAVDPDTTAGVLCRKTAAEMRRFVELYIQRFDSISDRLEYCDGDVDASLLSEAKHVMQVTIDYWVSDQASVAELLLEAAGSVADSNGDDIGVQMEDAILGQLAQSETSLANLKYAELEPTVGPHRVNIELDNIRKSLRILDAKLKQCTESLEEGNVLAATTDNIGERLCDASPAIAMCE